METIDCWSNFEEILLTYWVSEKSVTTSKKITGKILKKLFLMNLEEIWFSFHGNLRRIFVRISIEVLASFDKFLRNLNFMEMLNNLMKIIFTNFVEILAGLYYFWKIKLYKNFFKFKKILIKSGENFLLAYKKNFG